VAYSGEPLFTFTSSHMNQSSTKTNDFAAAFTLMLMAPLLTEVLPGATRFSSIFVFPIEVVVWGGGALMIRYAVIRWQLGWLNMLFMAIALSIAEECIIQQTSFAPMVIHLKGVVYARALGINYVYLLWALIYESVFAVFLPIYLVELIFAGRKQRPWISKGGFFAVIPLFIIGSILAWFSWTRIARPKVFKLPVYNPAPAAMAIAFAIIIGLVFIALRYFKNKTEQHTASLKPPAPWLLFISGAVWASLLFGLVLLGFGVAPDFAPLLAICGGLVLVLAALYFLPGWTSNAAWQRNYSFALIFGTIMGSMLISFIGFIRTTGPDLYFKIITNVIAFILLILLGTKSKSNLTK
jgi:hypothetical protein